MPTAPRDGATSSAAGVSITFAASEAPGLSLREAGADPDFVELGRVAAASSASRAGTAQQLMAEMAAVLEAPSGTVLEPEPQLESMAEPADSDSDEFDVDPQSPRSDPADFLRERLAGELAPLALFSSAACIRAAQPPLSCPPTWGSSLGVSAQCDCAPSAPVRRRVPLS